MSYDPANPARAVIERAPSNAWLGILVTGMLVVAVAVLSPQVVRRGHTPVAEQRPRR